MGALPLPYIRLSYHSHHTDLATQKNWASALHALTPRFPSLFFKLDFSLNPLWTFAALCVNQKTSQVHSATKINLCIHIGFVLSFLNVHDHALAFCPHEIEMDSRSNQSTGPTCL